MAAGHSGRTAAQKLGVVPGTRLALIDAPEGWELEGTPEGVRVRADLRGHRDVTLAFVRSGRALNRSADRLERATAPHATLWIAWPRRAGGHRSDVTEDLLREVFLPRGLVDVKVAAIDADWSGLKFVWRAERRPPS